MHNIVENIEGYQRVVFQQHMLEKQLNGTCVLRHLSHNDWNYYLEALAKNSFFKQENKMDSTNAVVE